MRAADNGLAQPKLFCAKAHIIARRNVASFFHPAHRRFYQLTLCSHPKMLSLRAFTRSAPRALTRSFSVTARPASRLPTAFSRPTSLQSSLTKYQYSAFSTARVLRDPAGECM